ncbi:hypothetical protein COLO4_31643 [Corchorus olitorius]|uniref:Uncharacterized protein n=1 Tax=Corchorus olitorius TaxID=93759 RepID=A0A1R3H424_9ROSI|nr:hypothetical protein COLO4_31643 [Corchorus olitorius]
MAGRVAIYTVPFTVGRRWIDRPSSRHGLKGCSKFSHRSRVICTGIYGKKRK